MRWCHLLGSFTLKLEALRSELVFLGAQLGERPPQEFHQGCAHRNTIETDSMKVKEDEASETF